MSLQACSMLAQRPREAGSVCSSEHWACYAFSHEWHEGCVQEFS